MYRFVDFILLLALINFVQGQTHLNCTSLQNCADCIRSPECSWCLQSDFYGSDKQPLARCNTTSGHEELGPFKCRSEFLFTPQSEVNITKNESDNIKRIPLSPQEISVNLSRNKIADVKIVYRDPKDYPLDLYYLMDLTKTMEDDKKVLEDLGEKLASSISDITTKFRQGFGSFIDKVAMPYVMMTPNSLEDPCNDKSQYCVKPYGFRNHLKMTSEKGQFTTAVKNANLSASIDQPEGGFDALMQTMVCGADIGWEDKARRLVIFATDAPFHIAGDGKLGGIIHPNDGKCHMNDNGEYTHSTLMDYPSIAHLNHKAIQNSINIIFAVTGDQQGIYTQLAERIEGAKTAVLSANSSNIVDLVKSEYQAITSTVRMSDNLPRQYVQVKYFSNCNGQYTEEQETDTCSKLPIGSDVEFTVKFTLKECPSNREEWKQSYRIYRVGLPDGLAINLSMLCDCPCEYKENWIPKSAKCSGAGTDICGLCDCDKNHFGRLCECKADSRGVPVDEISTCKQNNLTDICSGRGQCDCGQCICNKRENKNEKYSGLFCECDNFSCDQHDGEICAGHGKCDCGHCQCSPEWSGTACECSTDETTCKEPLGTEMCSGQGKCDCGKCVCQGKYSGEFCEKCRHESCPTKCNEIKPCVECTVHKTGPYETVPSVCKDKCDSNAIKIVDVISRDPQLDEVNCKGEDLADQCSFYYTYGQYPNKTLYINAQKTKECPPQAPTFWIVVAIVSLIVAIGLGLILFWKIYTIVQDRKEYAHFQEESKNTTFGTVTNPLYNNPVGVYQNPAYGKPNQ